VNQDDEARATRRAQQERAEADLVSNRIGELYEKPIAGKFDLAHLRAVHAYLFQDTPHHHPGEIRDDTGNWSKMRALEGKSGTYEVAYLGAGVEARIRAVLDDFGGPAALRGRSSDEAAVMLARLYGDLDHAHGFFEGNSRTLREFTRSLAAEAGFVLDWTGTNVTADQRNTLYAARDLEVITRHFPNVTPETAERRDAYEAALQADSFRRTLGDHPLQDLIRKGLTAALVHTVHISDPDAAAEAYWARLAGKPSTGQISDLQNVVPDHTQSPRPTRGSRLK
jgi:fido (protein-threonine AMPylation protein)